MQGPSPEHLGPGHVGMAGPFPKSLLEFLSPLAACGPHSLPAYSIIAPNHPILPAASHQSVCGPGALARSHFTLGSELVTTIGASPPLLAEQPLGTMTTLPLGLHLPHCPVGPQTPNPPSVASIALYPLGCLLEHTQASLWLEVSPKNTVLASCALGSVFEGVSPVPTVCGAARWLGLWASGQLAVGCPGQGGVTVAGTLPWGGGCLNDVLGRSEMQELFWRDRTAYRALAVCFHVDPAAVGGRRAPGNGGVLVGGRSGARVPPPRLLGASVHL